MTPSAHENAQEESTGQAGGGKPRDTILGAPQIRLVGTMDEAMYKEFRDQLAAAPDDGPLVIAITTTGGNPEVARAMADDVQLMLKTGREMFFLGKAAVYSAGVTFMAGFPVPRRFVTPGTTLMIHERQLDKTINLSGPLKSCTAQLEATLNEIKQSIAIEEEGFRLIIDHSDVDFDEVKRKAPDNWYIECDEAKQRGLIAHII